MLGKISLAAHSCITNLGFFYFPVPFSVGLATTIRIGNLLGEGNASAAKVAGRAGLAVIWCFIVCLMLLVSEHCGLARLCSGFCLWGILRGIFWGHCNLAAAQLCLLGSTWYRAQ